MVTDVAEFADGGRARAALTSRAVGRPAAGGFALGRKLKTTIIVKRNLHKPYMLEGFGVVAAKLRFLPEVHIYEVDDVDEAVRLIGRNGRQLLLPD